VCLGERKKNKLRRLLTKGGGGGGRKGLLVRCQRTFSFSLVKGKRREKGERS